MTLYSVRCEWSDYLFTGTKTWTIEADSEDDVMQRLEQLGYANCTYEVSKIIVEPVKTVTSKELAENRKARAKERAKNERYKLFEKLRAEFEPAKAKSPELATA